jgi:hypothetical protein
MTGFYSLPAPRIWRGEKLRRLAEVPQADPYGPDQPGYRARARETATKIGNGMVRVDIGEPIARAHGAPQTIPLGSPADPPEDPDSASEVAEGLDASAPDLLSVLRATSLPQFKPGLGRG